MRTILWGIAVGSLVACGGGETTSAGGDAALDWVGDTAGGGGGADEGGSGGGDAEGNGGGGSDGLEPCQGPTGLQVGDCAPEFTLLDSDGVSTSLSEQIGGRVLVMGSASW